MSGREEVLAKTNLPWARGDSAQKRTKANKGGGGGVKTRESWANVLFECPKQNKNKIPETNHKRKTGINQVSSFYL